MTDPQTRSERPVPAFRAGGLAWHPGRPECGRRRKKGAYAPGIPPARAARFRRAAKSSSGQKKGAKPKRMPPAGPERKKSVRNAAEAIGGIPGRPEGFAIAAAACFFRRKDSAAFGRIPPPKRMAPAAMAAFLCRRLHFGRAGPLRHRNPDEAESLGGLQAGEPVIASPSDAIADGPGSYRSAEIGARRCPLLAPAST